MIWSFPPKKILVAVDFGEASARALGVAGALARAFGAEVRALHAEVLDAPPYFTHDQVTALDAQRRMARASAELYLTTFAAEAGAGAVRPVVVDGAPAESILHQAAEADLVVMGTHGRRGANRWWLGSVAEKVVRAAAVPVLVVRDSVAQPPERVFARVVAGQPMSHESGHTRRYAQVLSQAFGGELIDGTETCTEEVARQVGATLLVIGSGYSERLRDCRLPLLFVPQEGGRRNG